MPTGVDKNIVKVKILDKTYALRATKSPEHLQQVAAFVDERLREMKESMPDLSTTKLAVLTSINIADELFSAAPSGEDETVELRRSVHSLIEEIEDCLNEE